jgi:hypothetical protein
VGGRGEEGEEEEEEGEGGAKVMMAEMSCGVTTRPTARTSQNMLITPFFSSSIFFINMYKNRTDYCTVPASFSIRIEVFKLFN